MRNALVAALVACADNRLRPKTRRFVLGLSSDEMQFIAEFLGSCILESPYRCGCTRAQLATRIAKFQEARQGCSQCHSRDDDHKMIVLLEYLCRSGVPKASMTAGASHA